METVNKIKALIAAVCGALTALWGWFGWLVLAWIGMMALDYLTGTAAAFRAGTWSSKLARDGIWHKTGCVVAVITAGILDLVVGHILEQIAVPLPFTYTVFLCPLVVVWYLLTEMGSVVENAGSLGAPIPGWLRRAIEALKDKVDEAGGEEGEKKI